MADAFLTSIDAQHPWPWLDPFVEDAKRFFHGRSDDAHALLRGVLASPVSVLFGKSGLGKTSLLLAGLFPLLRDRGILPVAVRRLDHSAGAPDVSSQLRRALDDAIANAQPRLSWNFAPDESGFDAADEGSDVAFLWELLHNRGAWLTDASDKRWTIAFVIDQFEEIFTLQSDDNLRRQTFEQLGDLLENRLPPSVAARMDANAELVERIDIDAQRYRVVIALREDFLPELELWTGRIPRLATNRHRLLPMSEANAIDAIVKAGGSLVNDTIARAIVEFLGRQVASGSEDRALRGPRSIEPALLSLVCASLNVERLAKVPVGDTLDVGNLEGRGARILDQFYDDAFAAVPDAQRAAATRWVETDLITASGSRRPYPLDAVEANLTSVIPVLVNRRLIRIEPTDQGALVELVHDRLGAVARQRAQASRQRAETEVRMRQEQQVAEVERARRKKRAAYGLSGLLLFFVLVLLWLYTTTQRAKVQAQRAMVDAARARDSLQFEVVRSRVFKAAYDSQRVASVLAESAARILRAPAQSGSVAEVNSLLRAAAGAERSAKFQVQTISACPAGRRLYPQVGVAADSMRVARARAELRLAGFIVPEVEVKSPSVVPMISEVRYFRLSERQGAQAAGAALLRAGFSQVRVRLVRGYETSTRIRACHYELWVARNADSAQAR